MLTLLVLANLSCVSSQVHLVERGRVYFTRVPVRRRLTEASQTLSVSLRIVLMPAVDFGEGHTIHLCASLRAHLTLVLPRRRVGILA